MKLSVAKFRLYNKNPFLGTLIFNLEVKKVDKKLVPTAAVDGEKLYYSEKFWNSLNNKQQLGVLAHELAHIFLGHALRKGTRNDMVVDPNTGQPYMLWNVACDYAVNLIVTEMLSSDYLPPDCLIDNKYQGWSAEKIYSDLQKRTRSQGQNQGQGKGKGGQGGREKQNSTGNQIAKDAKDKQFDDHSRWGKKSRKEQRRIEKKVKQLMKQAVEYQRSKKQGKLPALIERMYEEMDPKEDWRKVLVQYAQPFNDDYTFASPDRRYLNQKFILPDIAEGSKVDWIAIAIDTSGSIGQSELSNFIAEVKGILESFDKVKAKVTYCDANATPFVELDDVNNIPAPQGGGGTDFRPVYDLIEKEGDNPKALVYFTDLFGSFPDKPGHFDTVWVATETEVDVPFGKVLEYDGDN